MPPAAAVKSNAHLSDDIHASAKAAAENAITEISVLIKEKAPRLFQSLSAIKSAYRRRQPADAAE